MFSIGEISRRTGVKVPTIRYYEEMGLLSAPERTAGNQRNSIASHKVATETQYPGNAMCWRHSQTIAFARQITDQSTDDGLHDATRRF